MGLSENIKQLKGKKIVIWGGDSTGLSIINQLELSGMEVSYAVDSNKSKQGTYILGKEIHSPYDLIYEDKKIIRIVVCSLSGKSSIIASIHEMGFDDENIVTSFIENRDKCDHIDVPLGISRGKNTIVSIGENAVSRAKKCKILILGGSTSDPYFLSMKSWSEYFFEYLSSENVEVEVLNAAVTTYSTTQEMLILLREGLMCRPNIVISYSGTNDYMAGLDLPEGGRISLIGRNLYDLQMKLLNSYNYDLPDIYFGERTDEYFNLYMQNQRCMHAVCEEFGIKFVSFLQPTILGSMVKKETYSEKLMKESVVLETCRRNKEFLEKYNEVKENYPYIVDYSYIFSDVSDVFIDACHVNEKGNAIIGRQVGEYILKNNFVERN